MLYLQNQDWSGLIHENFAILCRIHQLVDLNRCPHWTERANQLAFNSIRESRGLPIETIAILCHGGNQYILLAAGYKDLGVLSARAVLRGKYTSIHGMVPHQFIDSSSPPILENCLSWNVHLSKNQPSADGRKPCFPSQLPLFPIVSKLNTKTSLIFCLMAWSPQFVEGSTNEETTLSFSHKLRSRVAYVTEFIQAEWDSNPDISGSFDQVSLNMRNRQWVLILNHFNELRNNPSIAVTFQSSHWNYFCCCPKSQNGP